MGEGECAEGELEGDGGGAEEGGAGGEDYEQLGDCELEAADEED